MRVLLVHCHYQIRSGEDQVYSAEKEALAAAPNIELDVYEDDNARIEGNNSLRTAAETIWSRNTHRKISEVLARKPYDIVHIHNFFPLLSPAVHHAARAADAAVVQTLHNFRLFCLNGIFFRQGKICEDCLGQPMLWPGIVHRCYRDNRLASSVVATMLQSHRAMKTWEDNVDLYITLYESWRQKFIQCGLPGERIMVKANFLHDPGMAKDKGNFALFAGRLTRDKGVPHILKAWQQLGRRLPLKILGDGPLKQDVVRAAKETPGIEYLGTCPYGDFLELLGRARFALSASTWFEAPRVVMEAYARGVPMIASAIGPSAELVHDRRTGLHFKPGDVDDMVRTIEWWLDHPETHGEMAKQARLEYEAKYTPEISTDRLLKIYEQAIERQASRYSDKGAGPVLSSS